MAMGDPVRSYVHGHRLIDIMASPNADPEISIPALAQTLGHEFKDLTLLREAVTHPSTDPQHRGPARFGYERLEFLGDRVLGLLIAEWLLERFPHEPEGPLAKRHTALVRRESLAQLAREVGLGQHLILSAGEAESGGRENEAILSDVCEAVIAALYIDGGIEPPRRFLRTRMAVAIDRHATPPQDSKTTLQEWAQARGLPLPDYQTVSRSGPDHRPLFEIRVSIKGHPPASATGSSKRIAERQAAAALMDALQAGEDDT